VEINNLKESIDFQETAKAVSCLHVERRENAHILYRKFMKILLEKR